MAAQLPHYRRLIDTSIDQPHFSSHALYMQRRRMASPPTGDTATATLKLSLPNQRNGAKMAPFFRWDAHVLRTAVIGVGYLGRFHAQKYAQSEQCDLVAVADIEVDPAMDVAAECHTDFVTDYHELIGQVDAVSIVTPTPQHFAVAELFIRNGIHVLIEKPITATLSEAEQLIQLSKQHRTHLQVGHLERFNNGFLAAQSFIESPQFIDCQRISPFKLRGSDVSVILDLMIHDIDLVHALVPQPIVDIQAVGRCLVSSSIDIANARLHFANGTIANLTASRIDVTSRRSATVYQENSQLTIDLANKTIQRQAVGANIAFPGIPDIIEESFQYDQGDALRDQIEDFLYSIHHNRTPAVSGKDGLQALQTADRISAAIEHHQSTYGTAHDSTTV